MNLLKTIGVVSIFALAVIVTACKDNQTSSTSEQGEKTQESVMQKAQSAQPTYQPDHFLTRKNINKWMKRMDDPSKIYYVYLVGDNGNIIGYHTASTRPTSTCTYLTPPERIEVYDGGSHGAWNPIKRTAPSLDGVYRKGGSCSVFFFTADTDAFVQIPDGLDYLLYDQPLGLDVQELKVSVTKE